MPQSVRLCLLAVLCLLSSPVSSSAGSGGDAIAIIAHKQVALTTVEREDLRPLFQTKTGTWPDGSPAKPFNLPDSNPVRHGFDAAVLGLDPDRAVRYWIDRKIRGGERPPSVAPSSAVMLAVVSRTPGAVGYVEAKAVDKNVKVIAVVVNGLVTKP
jgi:ABC-type phosphate transport system substrate-binding protein